MLTKLFFPNSISCYNSKFEIFLQFLPRSLKLLLPVTTQLQDIADRAARRKLPNTSHTKAQPLGHFCRARVSEVNNFLILCLNQSNAVGQPKTGATEGILSGKTSAGQGLGQKSLCLLQCTLSQIWDEARTPKPHRSPATHRHLSNLWQRSPKSFPLISLEKVSLPLLSTRLCTGLSNPPAGKSHRHQIYRAYFFAVVWVVSIS